MERAQLAKRIIACEKALDNPQELFFLNRFDLAFLALRGKIIFESPKERLLKAGISSSQWDESKVIRDEEGKFLIWLEHAITDMKHRKKLAKRNKTLKNESNEREMKALPRLKKMWPPEEGYKIVNEVYLVYAWGDKAINPRTKKGRRIDWMVYRDDVAVALVEVTTRKEKKGPQMKHEKEVKDIIRKAGSKVYGQVNKTGEVVLIPGRIRTRIWRYD